MIDAMATASLPPTFELAEKYSTKYFDLGQSYFAAVSRYLDEPVLNVRLYELMTDSRLRATRDGITLRVSEVNRLFENKKHILQAFNSEEVKSGKEVRLRLSADCEKEPGMYMSLQMTQDKRCIQIGRLFGVSLFRLINEQAIFFSR